MVAEPSAPRARILVAEDNRINQLVMTKMLERDGYLIVVAQNGREAVELLREQAFDVVLMDVQMPELDGCGATAAIRAKESTTGDHIPIIAVTAHAMTGDKEKCLEAGMDAYLAKPYRAAELLAVVEEQLQRSAARSGS